MASSKILESKYYDRLYVNRLKALSAKINEYNQDDDIKKKMLDYLNTVYNKESIGCYALFNPDDSLNFEITEFGDSLDSYNWSASLSKPFTTLLMAYAQKQGILNIKDKAIDYLPTFKDTILENATIEDLMSMRAGVPGDDITIDYTIPPFNTFDAGALSIFLPGIIGLPFKNTIEGTINIVLKKDFVTPIYPSNDTSSNSYIGSKIIKEYIPGTGTPSDISYQYSSLSIMLAACVLVEALAKSKNYTQIDGYTTMPFQEFVNWSETLTDKMTNNEYRVYLYSDVNAQYFLGGAGLFTKNKFYVEIFKLIKNNGVINGEQVLDREYIESINNFDINDTNDSLTNNWNNIKLLSDYIYYNKGVAGYYKEFLTKDNVLYHYGAGGILIATSQNNYMSCIFCKSTIRNIPEKYYNLPFFRLSYDIEDSSIVGEIFFKYYTKLTLSNGTQLNTKEDWDNLTQLLFNKYDEFLPLFRFPSIEPSLAFYENIPIVESLLNINLSSIKKGPADYISDI